MIEVKGYKEAQDIAREKRLNDNSSWSPSDNRLLRLVNNQTEYRVPQSSNQSISKNSTIDTFVKALLGMFDSKIQNIKYGELTYDPYVATNYFTRFL